MSPNQLLSLSLVLTVLTACASSNDNFYPLESGIWRYYETTTKILDDIKQQRIIAGIADRAKSDQGEIYILRQAPNKDAYLRVAEDGIYRVATRERHLLVETWEEIPTKILPIEPRIGDSWTVTSELALIESRTFARQDKLRNRTIPLELTVQVVSLTESVTVPAGTFEQCVLLESHGAVNVKTDRGNANADVSVVRRDWYAPGVGLVKSERVEESESPFLKPGFYKQKLLAVGE
ncbi:MAG: TapB family protein [Gammaproteobacteria bacterium]